MNNLFNQIFQILINPPGNLVFHLVLAFSVLAALQAVFNLTEVTKNQRSRQIIGLSVLLAGQFFLFLAGSLSWQQFTDPHWIIPPLDRAIYTISLLWIIWMWGFSERNPAADTVHSLLNIGVVIFFIVTYLNWTQFPADSHFNSTIFDLSWTLLNLALALAGIALMLIRRKGNWGVGLGFFIINLAGIGLHLAWASPNENIPAAIRLAQICTFPLLPSLARNLSVEKIVETDVPAPQVESLKPKTHYGADLRLSLSWLNVAAQSVPEKKGQSFTEAVSRTMIADLCFLLNGQEGYIQVIAHSGFDLIREESLPGASFETSQLPTITASLQRGKSIRLSSNGTPPQDLKSLAATFGLRDAGHLLAVPIKHNKKEWSGIVLMTPYSNYAWNMDDQTYLQSIAETANKLFESMNSQAIPMNDQEYLLESIKQLRTELESSETSRHELQKQLDNARLISIPNQPDVEIQSLVAVQHELENENIMLREALARLQESAAPNEDKVHLETELRMTLEELARQTNALAEANMKLITLQQQPDSAIQPTDDTHEVVAAIVQELRQPLSSILGYTDLMLNESAGILGALQRKFLERIKASIERMRNLLDDLLQVASFSKDRLELIPQPVDLDSIIDQAIAETSTQMREKSINLLVDLPNELPKVCVDRDAFQQILVHLLQNAGLASPTEGTIQMEVSVKEETAQDAFLLIQVTDAGGGIEPDYLNRVFNRRYRADHALIQGIGDTGVGLSIVKTLVEAHGGRVWVESDPGNTTTFSIVMPIQPNQNTKIFETVV